MATSEDMDRDEARAEEEAEVDTIDAVVAVEAVAAVAEEEAIEGIEGKRLISLSTTDLN